MSTLRKASRNLGLLSSAQLAGRVVGLFVSALIARHLGQAGFGHYQLSISFPAIFGILARLGVGPILVRELAGRPERGPRYVSTSVVMAAAQGVVTVSVVSLAALALGYRGDEFVGIVIMSLALVAMAYETLFYSVFESADRMDREAAMVLVRQFSWTALSLFLVWRGTDYLGLLWALLVTGVIVAIVAGVLTYRRMFPFGFSFDREAAGRILKAGIPLAIAALLVDIYLRIGILMLDRMTDPAKVGLYSSGYRIIESLMFVSSSFFTVVFPIFSRLYTQGDEERLRYAYTQSLRYVSIVLVPMSMGISVLAGPILGLIFGREFIAGAPALAVVAWVVALQGLSVVMGRLLIVVHRQNRIIWISLVTVILNVGLNLLLIPRWGIAGSATASVASEATVVLLNWFALGGAVQRPNLIAGLWRIWLAAGAMGLAVWWARHLSLGATIALGVVVYPAVYFALGGVTKEDRVVLMRILKRA